MNSKKNMTNIYPANNQTIQAIHQKQTGGGMDFLVMIMIAIWLVEQILESPRLNREIEI